MVSINDRFKKKLSKPNINGCIKWLGWKNDDGYGKFSVGKLYKFAHRFSWELFVGIIPNGKCVLHKCDERDCCNPNHLYVGTQFDNMQDLKNRKRSSDKRGEKNGHAKLTENSVRYIRTMFGKLTVAQLARDFNVSETCISLIKFRKSWKYL